MSYQYNGIISGSRREKTEGPLSFIEDLGREQIILSLKESLFCVQS